jgi:hypothetical protein
MRNVRALGMLLLVVMMAMAGGVRPAEASRAGRRNVALGATGLAIYELAGGHTGTGLLAAAGAGYAWNQYNDAHRSHRSRRHAFMEGYRAGVRRTYGAGFRPRHYYYR